MSNSTKIRLLILALALMGLNAAVFLFSSQILDGLTTQLEETELNPEELARVTETARTTDEAKGEEGEVGLEGQKKPVSGHEKNATYGKDEAKLASKVLESEHGAKEVSTRDEKENKTQEDAEEPETGVIRSKYRPKLIGQCKNLFAKYEKKGDFTGNHRAFTYSFDGNSGNCAIVEEQKSKQIAEREALKACEKSKTDAANYAPCFVIASF